MTTYAITSANVSYRGSLHNLPLWDGGAPPANQGMIFDWIRGKGTAPLRGRPVLIRMVGGGYTTSQKPGVQLDTADADYRGQLCGWWADMGGSVIVATGTTVDNAAPHTKYTSNGKTTSGVIMPPGFTPSGAGFVPYGHADTPMYYTDAIQLLQHVKHNIDTYEGDPENIWVLGDSFSNHGWLWACLKERAGELGATGQYLQSTRVRGMFLDRPGMVRWASYDPTLTFPSCPAGATLAAGDYTTPQATLAGFPTAAQVGVEFKTVLSLLGAGGYGDMNLIRGTRMFLSTGVAGPGDTTAVNTIIDPAGFAGLSASEPAHSAHPNSVLRFVVDGAPCEFWCGTDAAKNSVANEDGAYGTDGSTSPQRTTALVAEWLRFAKKEAFTFPALRGRPDVRELRRRQARLRHAAFP